MCPGALGVIEKFSLTLGTALAPPLSCHPFRYNPLSVRMEIGPLGGAGNNACVARHSWQCNTFQ